MICRPTYSPVEPPSPQNKSYILSTSSCITRTDLPVRVLLPQQLKEMRINDDQPLTLNMSTTTTFSNNNCNSSITATTISMKQLV